MNLINILQKITKQKVLFPFYHAVAEKPLPHIKHLYRMKTITEFQNDLGFLLKHYEPVDIEILHNLLVNKIVPQKPVFHLTFDDGLKEIYEVVAPILVKKGIPATFFINSGFAGNKGLFYRYQASLALDELTLGGNLTNPMKKEILSITYNDRHKLFQYFSQKQVEDFLNRETPYLTVEQIKSLSAQGFTIGAHSVDHPHYYEIPLDEQLRQTRESLNFVTSIVDQKWRLFAFPFTDYKVFKQFFDTIKPDVDLSFGTAGLKNDEVPYHHQRIEGEKANIQSIESVLIKEHIKYVVKSFLKKNHIRRK